MRKLTLLKEHYIPDWAKRFQSAGFSALIYDHRGWGSSEGMPRNEVDPAQQAEDYHDAVLFAQTLPTIDPSRVAIWGIGHSGGAVMTAAGDDPNIKAVICVMPFISGSMEAPTYPEGMIERAWTERRSRVEANGESKGPEVLQVWDESIEEADGPRNDILLHGPIPYRFITGARQLSTAAGTPWENKLTVESLYHISKAEPRNHVHKIAPRPLLYLAASEDPPSGPFEEQRKVFEQASGKKDFVRLEGEHIKHYFDKNFEKCIDVQIQWLKTNL